MEGGGEVGGGWEVGGGYEGGRWRALPHAPRDHRDAKERDVDVHGESVEASEDDLLLEGLLGHVDLAPVGRDAADRVARLRDEGGAVGCGGVR